eukprot:5781010-Karenia_brevis.AAC.1
MALYKDGTGVSLSNGPRNWGPINEARRDPVSPYTVLQQVTIPYPTSCERLLSGRQVFRVIGGQEIRDAPGFNFEDTTDVLSSWHISAQ